VNVLFVCFPIFPKLVSDAALDAEVSSRSDIDVPELQVNFGLDLHKVNDEDVEEATKDAHAGCQEPNLLFSFDELLKVTNELDIYCGFCAHTAQSFDLFLL